MILPRAIESILCAVVLAATTIAPSPAFPRSVDNPCPEGWYQDLSDDERRCRELAFDPSTFSERLVEELEDLHIDTERTLHFSRRTIGFDFPRFEDAFRGASSRVFPVSECTEAALRSSLAQAGDAGGGVVELPACRLRIEGELALPALTILTGHGRQSTVLEFIAGDRASWGSILKIDQASNIVVRDLSLHRSSRSRGGDLGVSLNMSDNVLLERVNISGVRVAAWAQHSSNFTIRYSVIEDLAKESGDGKPIKAISFGECDQASGSKATTASCESTRGFQQADRAQTGVMWSAGFAFYSNVISGVDSWGSSSASAGEIAGNRYEFGLGQLKIDDGQFVLIHHNLITNIRDFVVFRVATEIGDRGTRRLGFYENRLERNSNPGGYLLNLTTGEQVYLLNNHYRNNTGKIMLRPRRGFAGEVYMCPYGEEAQPIDASAHEGASRELKTLDEYDRLCEPDGGRYLFRD